MYYFKYMSNTTTKENKMSTTKEKIEFTSEEEAERYFEDMSTSTTYKGQRIVHCQIFLPCAFNNFAPANIVITTEN